jgi:hypothetical protein
MPKTKQFTDSHSRTRILRAVERVETSGRYGQVPAVTWANVKRWGDATHFIVQSLDGTVLCAIGAESNVLYRLMSDERTIRSGGTPYPTFEAALNNI